jgi:hypothetical protein
MQVKNQMNKLKQRKYTTLLFDRALDILPSDKALTISNTNKFFFFFPLLLYSFLPSIVMTRSRYLQKSCLIRPNWWIRFSWLKFHVVISSRNYFSCVSILLFSFLLVSFSLFSFLFSLSFLSIGAILSLMD